MIRKIRYAAEAILLYVFFFLFRMMPAKTASNLGGWLGRVIGPRMAASRKAYRNLQRAIPDLSKPEQDAIIRDMWDHLGRVIAEYPHLAHIAKHNTIIEGQEHLKDLPSAIFIGAHLGNWEVNCPASLLQLNLQIDGTYRAPNNPWVDRLLMRLRSMRGRLIAHPKSRSGGRSLMKTAKNGTHIAFLIDQKYNEGIAADFFGYPAMTNPIFVQLAQKYDRPIIPVQNIRTGAAQFRLIVHPPLTTTNASKAALPEIDIINAAHTVLEDWIRKHPEQWLWLHRRWKD